MSSLLELSAEYEESAELIRQRLKKLRKELAEAGEPEKRWHLEHRIKVLTPMLTRCNKMARHCKMYYERGYYIGDGSEQYRRSYSNDSAKEQAALQGCAIHYSKRANTRTAICPDRVSISGQVVPGSSGRKRRKQVDYFSHVLPGDS